MASGATKQVLIKFLGDTKGLDQAAGRGEKSMTAWEKTTSKVMKTVGGLFAGAAVLDFFKSSVTLAADAEQAIGAVDAVFKSNAQQVHQWAESSARDVGLSETAYREMATTTAAQLKNMGIAQEDVAEISNDLVTKGADLAAQFGGPTSEAVAALGSLLRGETDPIERYGISIKQADIEAQVAAMGLSHLEGEAEKTAKTQAILTLINEQGADAWGTFAREGGSAAQEAQVARAQFENLQVTIGEALLPVLTNLANWANDTLIPALQDMADWVKENRGVIEPLAKWGGQAALAIAGMATAVKGFEVARGITRTALKPFAGGLKDLRTTVRGGVIAAGLAAIAAGISEIAHAGPSGAKGVEQTKNEIVKINEAAENSERGREILDGLFSDLDNNLIVGGDGVTDFGAALDRVFNPSNLQRYSDFANFILPGGDSKSKELANVEEGLRALDSALADLVSSGKGDEAAATWEYMTQVAEEQGVSVDELKERFPEYTDAIAGAENATDDAADASQTYAEVMAAQGDETEIATEKLQAYVDEVKKATDPVYALNDAVVAVDEAQTAYNEAVEEFGPNSDEAQQAAIDLMGAVGDLEQAAIDGDLSFQDFEAKLRSWVEQGVVTQEQADTIRERVRVLRGEAEDYQGTYNATIEARDKATPVIDRVKESLEDVDGEVATTYLDTVRRWIDDGRNPFQRVPGGGRVPLRAAGGPVFPGFALVGEEGPELVRFGTAGTVTQHEESMGLLSQLGGGGDVHVSVEISRREIEGIAEVTVERNGRKTRRAVMAGAVRA